MSLGLPTHLSRAANSRALATAARWAGLVCLVAALVNALFSGFGQGVNGASWLTLAMLLPMVALLAVLALLARGRTVALTIAYLAVGTVCTYFYVVAIFLGTPAYRDTNLFVVALPVVAMTLVGGTGTGALAGILWASLGFALAEAAVLLAAVTTDRVFTTDAISLGAYLLLVGVLAFDGLTRGSRGRTQSAIHRAVRDVRLVELRRSLVADLAADTHDTVLSELLAVSRSEPGPLPERLRERIDADLLALGRGLPSLTQALAAEGIDDDPWYRSDLHRAIEDARDEGLAVDVSGDRASIARLDETTLRAIGLAVRQCLVNVIRHSGSATAEVALSICDDSLSVMVVDGGRGFAPDSTAGDRLGLRQSVHDRISRVGGTVTVYSSADVGTTVIMVVPCAPEVVA
ncbi:sensor histidine kinase [Leifsonia naganoensis]|uniref:Signal transduction histidine kinase n=1 Tax=Leifsonia naganoensis TaxID=150025 RepID=A0A853DRB4_9MICO|nr:ATP-binding protein [Leifsonia naganoensis]NYK08891.1 signal transduction histidine kinase [Leifsonia naganoensis]